MMDKVGGFNVVDRKVVTGEDESPIKQLARLIAILAINYEIDKHIQSLIE